MKSSVLLKGGLGNQLFQYAFAYSISKKYNLKIKINKYYYIKAKDSRSFSLNNMNIPDLCVMGNFNSFIEGTFYRAKRKIITIFNKQNNIIDSYYKKNLICNYNYGFYDISNVNFRKKIYIDGHFQSKRYFDDYKNDFKNMFRSTHKLSDKNLEIIKKIKNENAVCLHIRRGDFLLDKNKVFNVCSKNYYEKAINFLRRKIENPVFYIFSNNTEDLKWIKENYDFTKDMIFVDNNNSDVDELSLMSNFEYFIMSNSTFSWWAQYLANPQMVIAPSKWMNNNEDWKELYDDKWVLIEV